MRACWCGLLCRRSAVFAAFVAVSAVQVSHACDAAPAAAVGRQGWRGMGPQQPSCLACLVALVSCALPPAHQVVSTAAESCAWPDWRRPRTAAPIKRRLPPHGGSRRTAAPVRRQFPPQGGSHRTAAPATRRLSPRGDFNQTVSPAARHGASHQTADLSNSRCAGFWGSLMSPGARDARLDVNVGHGTLWLRSLPERDSCECCCPRGHGETCSPAILLLNLSRLASQSDLNGSEFCAAHALLGRAAQRRVCCATHNKRCSARTHAQPAASGPTVAVEGHPALPRGQEQWGAFLSGCDGRVQQRCTGVDASGALTQHGQARLARAAFSPGQTSLFS